MSQRFLMHAGVAAAALCCALFAFAPGFDNGFYRDDFVLLERAEAARHDPSVLAERWVEPFNRPLSQLLFYLEYQLWGLDSGLYIVTSTLVHALNAALLFALFQGPLGAQVAAGAAILFGLGFGFYGKAVLWAANLPELVATTFVLGTGVAALRAQLERTPRKRLAAMGIAGLLFLLALLCKESGLMALLMVGGLMWPQRRSLSSVTRKLAVLVVISVAYLGLQIVHGTGVARVLDPSIWLRLPLRAVSLAAFMTLPVQGDSTLVHGAGPLLSRFLILIDQTRPLLGLVLLAAGIFWFVRGPGAVRWLLASFLGFLLPSGLIQLPGTWLDIRYAYLPATCFCGLAAYGLRALWLRWGAGRRVVLALALFACLYADLALVRRLESKYDGFGKSAESQTRLQELESSLDRPR
ncbi:MAG: hypothetical protein ACE5G2_07530 [Candidatus Krumholzibacteriia bacterium]